MRLSKSRCPKCKGRLLVLDEKVTIRTKTDFDLGGILIVDGHDINYVHYCPRCDKVYEGKAQTK
jgi:uncharacterized protein YbaR (Trm112 family)